MERKNSRRNNELRPVQIQTGIQKDPDGSVLISYGETKIICCATIENKTPSWSSDSSKGWITAEYNMLPGSTGSRSPRVRKGRNEEIQRLIGRSLRASIDLTALGPRTITIDCDVLVADAGTRTASITGGFVALCLAIQKLIFTGKLELNPVIHNVVSVSCALCDGEIIVDPDYSEDSKAQVDMNFVIAGNGEFIEIQGTGEKSTFNDSQLLEMISYAKEAGRQLMEIQDQVIKLL
ncbi:ribonuclease PH [Myxococcota bacterium]|nr:ribonuclease PH [Myxococcota bacterium]MBU1379429.1 ribonuclease PH [Myxococcota bacterium]MBU1497632.1 ribonuclease PH [Myxococcota bacterium]